MESSSTIERPRDKDESPFATPAFPPYEDCEDIAPDEEPTTPSPKTKEDCTEEVGLRALFRWNGPVTNVSNREDCGDLGKLLEEAVLNEVVGELQNTVLEDLFEEGFPNIVPRKPRQNSVCEEGSPTILPRKLRGSRE